MARRVHLNELDSVVDGLEYPLTPEEAATECEDVTLLLADGEAQFDEVITQSSDDRFVSPDDLTSELMSLLPRHAVGEPYQSDGDA